MTMLEIIEKKKFAQELTKEEITFFAQAAAEKSVPDYQLSALLMAIRLNGMTDQETTDLTLAMRDSGDIADLSGIPGIKVDKHSTGGVGDTTTLVLAPLVAACGAPVAKMSGRGLGHTGGTLDKLESIPGLSVALPVEDFIRQVREIGVAVVGQTGHLAPADKTLYALRDVTSTVDSLPLIVSSILSQKLAAGSDAIVLDVKTGSGAIMHTLEDSLKLAQNMVRVGELAGKPIVALVSGMDQPLGTHVGNALEVKEAIDILAGRAGGDLLEVSLTLGGFMLHLAGKAETPEAGQAMMKQAIDSAASRLGKKVVLKVILETGLLVTPERIADASILAMEEGADFIKTSTGKVSVNATPVAAYVMCESIKAFFAKTGRKVGFKAAGGISTSKDAVCYYSIVKTILGDEWLNKDLFRFGVSRLANSLMSSIEQKTVVYF